MSSGIPPNRTHQADSADNLASVVVANGTPLSVQMRAGNP
jgi:hypothetical protein